MTFRVSGKNLDVGEALRERIVARISEAMSKYFDGGYSGHVTVEREGSGFSHRV
jgi:ribosome-associated translation inhibitor RaiA